MGFREFWDSLKSDVNEKSRNPFLGTFIVVWIIRHWPGVYMFFAFHKDDPVEYRITLIKEYFKDYDIYDLLCTIAITIIALVSGYILLNLTRLITNFFEFKITPLVYKTIEKTSVVNRDLYNGVSRRADNLKTELENLKLKLANSEVNENDWQSKFHEEVRKSEKLNKTIEEKELKILNKEFTSKKIKELNHQYKNYLQELIYEMSGDDLIKLYKSLIKIPNGNDLTEQEENDLVQQGFIKLNITIGTKKLFQLTPEGTLLYDILVEISKNSTYLSDVNRDVQA